MATKREAEADTGDGGSAPAGPPWLVSPPALQPASHRGVVGRFARGLDPRSIQGPALPLVVLGILAMAEQFDHVAVDLLFPEMRAEFGFSLQFLLTVTSVMSVFALVLGPALGYLADRIRRVWMLRVGLLLSNVGIVIQGLANGLPQLVIGRSTARFGYAVKDPVSFPLLTDYYPLRSRVRVFAFLGFCGALGGIAGPTVAGTLADHYGWRTAVVGLGAVATVATFGLFLLKEPVRGYQDRLAMGADVATAKRAQHPVSWSEAWRAARSITTVRRLWYATPFLQVAWVGTGTFLGLYFQQEFGMGAGQRGLIATLRGVVGLVCLIFAAPISERLVAVRPGRVMLALGGLLVLNAGAVVVLAFSHTLWFSVGVSMVLGFGFVAIGPALFALMSLVVPARVRGLGMQTLAPWQLVAALMLPFIGRAADSWGLRTGLLVFVPVYLIGALILASSAQGVDGDIRAATAASMADEEELSARARGRTKMLICRDVDVHHEGAQAVAHLDLDVEEGEMVALVGTNGAGKSSLLRAIAGVHEASNGAIFVDGHDVTHLPAHEAAARGVVLVAGGEGLFPTLSVRENLRAAGWLRRGDVELASDIDAVLALFPILRTRIRQKAGALSGGEQQMLSLGQAFVARPRLLLIDEISFGLAPGVVRQLLPALGRLRAEGVTIILVEQSLNLALAAAARAVFMERGSILFDGPAEALTARSDLLRPVAMGRAASAAELRPAATRGARVSQPKPVLDVRGLEVAFGGVTALNGVDLVLHEQEIVGIIGPNGAGKTTLFDIVSGFVRPGGEDVVFMGESLRGVAPDARARLGIARSFQDVRLFPSLTVRQNIAVARQRHLSPENPVLAAMWSPKVRGLERAVAERVDALVDVLGLHRVADRFVDELSTGQRRALDVACIMAAEPALLLLDEPSSGLAQSETVELGPILLRVARETGCAMAIIEHDLALVASVADRLIAMDLGRVLSAGTPSAVLEDPVVATAYLRASGEGEHGAAPVTLAPWSTYPTGNGDSSS